MIDPLHGLTELALLRHCRRLFVRDLDVQARIGVHDFEKRAAQRLRVNVELYVPLAHSTPTADELHEVVDYDFVREAVLARVQRGHVQLQETLADELLAVMLQHPLVHAARVRTEKPDVYADCAAVGVEVFGVKERA